TVLRDSSILVGGSFSQFGVAVENNLARLNGDGVPAAPSAPTNVAATATSSGSIAISWSDVSGESSYKIERSLDGVSGWVQVAEVPWDFTGYTDTGLATGTSYSYRVRASNNAGDSAYTTNASVPTYTGYQQWKVNNGYSVTEPDTSDADGDGIPLILEYALGTNPNVADQNALPVGQALNGVMALSYRRYRSDVTYTVEASTDLVNWSGTGVNQGSGPFPIAWISVGGNPAVYLRLKVTAP
ncbi:MAG: fibronectin type III domain-containing protein, partial [Chthoniobacteraceae bacterium]